MRTKALALATTVALATSLAACSEGASSSSEEDYPSETLEWTIAFGPGGGNDIMARTMVDILQEEDLYTEDIVIENLDGGSGAQGWGKVYSNEGSGYSISTTSGSFITTPLQADTGWTYEDFTPVGLFCNDDALFLVPGDSEIKTWDDWVAYAKANSPVAVGGIGIVNVDYILHALLAEQSGYEIKYVPYDEEGQVQTSLLSGAIEAMVSNPGSIVGQVDSGDMQPLLFTGEQPLPGYEDVPTAKSLGFGDMPSMPRGLILPPDAPEETQEWWIDTMKQVVETDAWQQYLEDNYLVEDVRWGEDFEEYLGQTQDEFEKELTELDAL